MRVRGHPRSVHLRAGMAGRCAAVRAANGTAPFESTAYGSAGSIHTDCRGLAGRTGLRSSGVSGVSGICANSIVTTTARVRQRLAGTRRSLSANVRARPGQAADLRPPRRHSARGSRTLSCSGQTARRRVRSRAGCQRRCRAHRRRRISVGQGPRQRQPLLFGPTSHERNAARSRRTDSAIRDIVGIGRAQRQPLPARRRRVCAR
jgi:hypothetical protein